MRKKNAFKLTQICTNEQSSSMSSKRNRIYSKSLSRFKIDDLEQIEKYCNKICRILIIDEYKVKKGHFTTCSNRDNPTQKNQERDEVVK